MTSLHAASSLAFTTFNSRPSAILPQNPISTSSSLTPLFSSGNQIIKTTKCNRAHKFSCSSSQSKSPSPIALSEMDKTNAPVKLTYLEGNSWLWEIDGSNILVDPILVGPLDFGIPWLYKAYKKALKNITLDDLPAIDCILITQSLDDHCHMNTLRPLSQKFPNAKVIATPNAKSLISDLFKNITFISPGESTSFKNEKNEIQVKAVAGPVLGPPWQNPENGYVVSLTNPQISVFLEPHCQPGKEVDNETADVVVTPIVKQSLPFFTLVSGQEDAIRLAKTLSAKYIVPMANAEMDASGLLSALVTPVGTIEKFKQLMAAELPGVELLIPQPGKPLSIFPKS